MKAGLIILSLFAVVSAKPQILFGNSEVKVRGPAPAGGLVPGVAQEVERVVGQELEGRVPQPVPETVVEVDGSEEQCCRCLQAGEECNGRLQEQEELDLVALGLINPRIVNRPPVVPDALSTGCPVGQTMCCSQSTSDLDLSGLARSGGCLSAQQVGQETWVQGCLETPVASYEASGVKECGTRSYSTAVGLQHGQSSPGEFPWTCLVLNQNNDFIGSCAVIPNTGENRNDQGTRKVITAAHKLKNVNEGDLLKVRVGEWDASGFKAPEVVSHQEYLVTRAVPHPLFNPVRLSNDIAVLVLERDLDLTDPYINSVCLPSCDQQFDHVFTNGSGSRCWVAGWGKDEFTGSFQFLQRKVNVPLVGRQGCEHSLRAALDRREAGQGQRFSLDPSELCAGGEEGKDACTGDGGSPLVCQAASGRWTVVGLVAWGVGCAEPEVPGVYTRVSHFREWIDSTNP